MLADAALAEDHSPRGFEASGEVDGRDLSHAAPQYLRVSRRRERVQIYNAVEGLVVVLEGDEVLQCPQVGAEMGCAARLYPAEYSLFGLHGPILTDAPGSARRPLMYSLSPSPLLRRDARAADPDSPRGGRSDR